MSATLKLHVGTRDDTKFTGTVDGDLDVSKVTFYADYENGANKEWAAATPAAWLEVTVLREIADREGWVVGKKLTVTVE